MIEEKLLLKVSTPGTTREISIFKFSPPIVDNIKLPKIYLQAGLHADEVPPMLVLDHLKKKLQVASDQNLLMAHFILVPQANPIGAAQFIGSEHYGRFDLTSQENFNRHFFDFFDVIKDTVGKNLSMNAEENKHIIRMAMQSALSEIIAKTELEDLRTKLLQLSFDADIVLDLHCDFEGLLHLYTGTKIFDLMKPLAQFMESKAQLISAESGGCPFDEAVTKIWWQLQAAFPKHPIPFGTLGATIELRGKQDVNDEMAEADAENLFQYFIHANLIKGTKLAPPALIRKATHLDATQFVKVASGGVLILKKSPGDWIKKGENIAEILHPLTSHRTPVVSEVDGQLLTITNQKWCYEGMYIGKIVGETSYRSGALLSAK
jgi:predicted deacylase